MTVQLLLVRHATSKWVEYADGLPRSQQRFGGRMNNVELSQRGWEEAEAFGVYMRRNDIRPTHYISSPAIRARQTHQGSQRGLLGRGSPAPLMIVTGLQEMTWGDWERQLRSVAEQPQWVAQRQRLGFDFCPPYGESYNMVRLRAWPGLLEVVRGVKDGSLICVHTHQNVIKALVYSWMGWSHTEAMAAKLDVVSITRLVYSHNRFQLEAFNQSTL